MLILQVHVLVINKIFFDLQFPRLLMAFYWFYRPMGTLCLYQRALKIFLALKRYVTFPWLESGIL